MENNVNNFHPIGRDAESYRSGVLIEAVTLKEIGLSELIGRYNLMLDRIAEQARRLSEARELLITLDWNDWDKRVDDWLAANPAPQEQTA